MLRIFFTADDLARTRVSVGPDPMWEALLSLNRLRRGDGTAIFDEWRRHVRPKVPGTTKMISELAPARGYAVDFVTPVTASSSLDEGLEAIRRTPRKRLRTDLSLLAAERPLPSWTAALADGDTEVLGRVAAAFRNYFDAALAPYWQQVRAHVDHERSRLARLIAEGGYERVLSGLHPSANWQAPVLEMDYPVDRELHLGGRGLLLVPSFFCFGMPITFRDNEFRPMLAIPIDHEIGWASPAGRSLVALLGRTRAKVLEAIANGGCTTSELARRTGTSLPTASQQASVLREAGLVTSRQNGQAMLHSITPLGRALVG